MVKEKVASLDFILVSESQKKQERAKARDLRHSSWWKNKLQEGVCYYCDLKVDPKFLTMDHKVPVSKGGKSTKNNIVLCCKDCNTKKKHSTVVEMLTSNEKEK
ncbi:MAG: HNH endonuclease [Bdellovibrionaceae bacterium]|nr:HNH endonuclease [Pseudobdellovibrionaceae bacterium]